MTDSLGRMSAGEGDRWTGVPIRTLAAASKIAFFFFFEQKQNKTENSI